MREWFRDRGLVLIIFCMGVALISCGGGGSSSGGSGGSTAGAITLTADPVAGIPADGASSSAITATVVDSAGEPAVVGTSVTFSTTLGFFRNGNTSFTMSIQGDAGIAVASLCSLIAGTAQVTVTSSGTSQRITVGFVVPTDIPATLALAADKTTVKSDDSNSAAITATVRAESTAVITGVPVTFTATGGEISASSAETDENGRAQVTFSAGDDRQNHTVTITASVSGLEDRFVEVAIVGTTVQMTPERTNIEIDAAPVPLVINVNDAGGGGIPYAAVTITAVSTAGAGVPLTMAAPTGMIAPSTYSGVTDLNGELTMQLSGTRDGGVTVTAEALGAAASKDFVVGAAGFVFGITNVYYEDPAKSLEEDPVPLYVGQDLTIEVNAPAPDQDTILFVTTVGTLTGDIGLQVGRVITEPVVGKVATAVLNAASAGMATIWVMDADDPYTTDSLKVDISPPVSDAAQIILQATPTTIETNAGDTSTSTLIATVTNAEGQVIRGAPVVFSMEETTGGGEFISPAIAYTNSLGQATATFTAGALPSGANGVSACAAVVDRADIPDSCVSIIIGGTAGSMVISRGTTIESVNDGTVYRLPMTVLVTDATGSPVSGAVVSLSAWPSRCATGYWEEIDDNECQPVYGCVLANEDVNRNNNLDDGEDRNGDQVLTPPQAAAGGLTPDFDAGVEGQFEITVTTDGNGLATFDLIYPKSSSAWIEDRITATTLVLGTETTSTTTFWLPWETTESCNLPNSPYSTKSLSLSASPSTLTADGSSTSTITAVVIDALNQAASGEIVLFEVTSGAGTVSPAIVLTSAGIAQTTYTAAAVAGTETVEAWVSGTECAFHTVQITLTAADSPTAVMEWTDLGDQQHVLFADVSYPSIETGAAIDSWYWTFRRANGALIRVSSAQNPGPIALGSPGWYVAQLTVTDVLGETDTVLEAVEVEAQDLSATMPTAYFDNTTGLWDLGDGEHFLFADQSSAAKGTRLASWLWQFRQADGDLISTSGVQHPGSVSLTGSVGDYFASLTVTNNLGESDTVMKAVVLAEPGGEPTDPTAEFTWADLGDHDHVLFTDLSFATPWTELVSWVWTFMHLDGEVIATHSGQTPGAVSLGGAGTYVVTLTVTDDNTPGRSDTATQMVTVE